MSDRNIFRPPVREEVDEELSFHVEMRVRELVAGGLTVDEARAQAMQRFGDIEEVAALIPARAAARVDPLRTIR